LDNRDLAAQLARAEVVERQWELTKQYLGNQDVALDDMGLPAIARIDDSAEPGAYHVFLPIAGEPYFIVIVLRAAQTGALALAWVYMEAALRVALIVESREVSAEEITRRTGITPSKWHAIGEPMGITPRRYERHMWQYEPDADVPAWFETKLQKLLDMVEPSAAEFAAIGHTGEIQVSIVYRGWAGDWQFGGLHLDADTARRIAALGASVDIKLEAFGPPMPDEEASD